MRAKSQSEMGTETWDRLWNRTVFTAGLRGFIPKSEELLHFYHRVKLNSLLRKVSFPKGQILELGCGSGMNSVNLLKDHSFEKATLVDFSQSALEIARKNTKDYDVHLVNSDIFDLDLDKRFDLVFSIGLLEHFTGKRRNKVIAIHRQFVKNDGFLIVIVPKKSFFSRLLELINKVQGYKEYPFTDQEVEELFEKNQLEVVKKEDMLLGIASGYLLRLRDR